MRISIIAILISLSVICYAQTDSNQNLNLGATLSEQPDTFILVVAHTKILPEIIRERAELERLINENTKNLQILISTYADPKKLAEGKIIISQDFKTIVVKN